MFSLFPGLLFLAPIAHALLRAAAGAVFLSLAWRHFKRRHSLAAVRFPIIGAGVWIPLFAAAVEGAIGVGLVAGAYTQGFAVLGAIAAAKGLAWKRRYPSLFLLSYEADALLLVVCLSLIMTGAGLFAVDLPL